jgi:hypothetical protein
MVNVCFFPEIMYKGTPEHFLWKVDINNNVIMHKVAVDVFIYQLNWKFINNIDFYNICMT